jgi:hypothetical protein
MTKIIYRIDQCKCGCHGTDPWHKKSFNRQLYGVTDTWALAKVEAYTDHKRICARAHAQLPWGYVTVVQVVLDNGHALGWFVERLS